MPLTYSVSFGFIVKAKNQEVARLKAKRNLKPARQRKSVDFYSCEYIDI